MVAATAALTVSDRQRLLATPDGRAGRSPPGLLNGEAVNQQS